MFDRPLSDGHVDRLAGEFFLDGQRHGGAGELLDACEKEVHVAFAVWFVGRFPAVGWVLVMWIMCTAVLIVKEYL